LLKFDRLDQIVPALVGFLCSLSMMQVVQFLRSGFLLGDAKLN
jgi:hypothetical protein